ncbi:DUF1206 domain-containing protein [Pararhizobium sp. IMCC21322]|uniref:DUF1206 domain-containing protein n=1 Tax=Pararhizobium sp. IMCC21322 TaxID=3067903 RepID=UPI0027421DA8|nr:DUF1206 domain-containing protein [Pararhizobium sp. IMCC21322]
MNSSKKWISPLARAGYACRGAVYLIIGCFTVLAAFGAGQNKDTKGALRVVLEQPLGDAMLAVMIIGLAGYILWRLVQSLLDTDDHGWSAKGLMVRAGLLASAFTYTALALFSLSLLGFWFETGSGSDGSGNSGSSGNSGGLAETMFGIVGMNYSSLALAAVFLGVAIAHWWKALHKKYADHFQASQRQMQFIHPVAIAGLTARGSVFALISVLLFYRYLNAGNSPSSTPNVRDALEFVQSLPFGRWLLLAMGIGLILFAAYSLTEAVWRKINVKDAGLTDQV